MATDFFQAQMDYVFFLYGLSYLLLAAVCLPLRKRSSRPMHWEWMFPFAVAMCLAAWLDTLQLALGAHPHLATLQLVLRGAALCCLIEFGRASTNTMTRARAAAWIHAPLLLLPIAALVVESSNVEAVIHYTLGLAGFLWAAAAFFRASQDARFGGDALFTSGIFLLLLAATKGLIVPHAGFFPASLLNTDTFFLWTGIPIHIVHCGLLVGFTVGVWRHYLQTMRKSWAQTSASVKAPHAWHWVVGLVLLLCAGAALTWYAAAWADAETRAVMVRQAALAANALDGRQFRRLSITPNDVGTPDFRRLREQLASMAATLPELRWMYTMGLRDGQVVCVIDSIPESAFGYELPGTVYEQPPPELLELFRSGLSGSVGPYTDEYGTFISTFAPIPDPDADGSVFMVGLDLDASRWAADIARIRMLPIALVLFLCLLHTGHFLARHTGWIVMQQAAAGERRLQEAQQLTHVGHWTYVPGARAVAWSDELFRICGLTPGGAIPRYADLMRRIHPEDRGRCDAVVREAFASGTEAEMELRLTRDDGSARHVALHIQAQRNALGQIVQYTGTVQDVSDQKRAQAEILSWQRRYEALIAASGQIVYEHNLHSEQVHWGGSLHRVTGYTPEELRGAQTAWKSLVHEADRAETLRKLDTAIEKMGCFDAQYRFRHKNGDYLWMHDRGYCVINTLENVPCIVGVMEDISAEKEAALALQENEERFRVLYSDAPDPILILDDQGEFVDCNNAALEAFGVSDTTRMRGSVLARCAPEFQPGGVASKELAPHMLRQALVAGRHQFEWTLRQQGREAFVVDLSLAVVHVRGEVRLLAYLRDITEKKRAEEKLREMSIMDELTGLHNRRGFLALAEQQLKIAHRFHQTAMLVYMDLDKLKWINDTMGHETGDLAIQDAAAVLRASFRSSDVVGRIGGDEFVGLALESEKGSGTAILRRIQENLQRHSHASDRPFALEISVGYAVYDPDAPCPLAELLKQGDAHMYEQKQKRQARLIP